MARMFVGRRALAMCALVAGGLMAPEAGAQQSARHRVSVRPAVGYPATWFRVRFKAPDSTGNFNGMRRYYVIEARGPAGGGGCASQVTTAVTDAQAGSQVRARLTPGRNGWCLGHFHGTVTEQEQPSCPFREVCPNYVVVIRTVGRFSFRVQHAPPGGDRTPPAFAGLESATTCTGGPVRPGETAPYHLIWKPAHDDVTPSSEIVYELFMSNRPGGENFSRPTWTSSPGARSFSTPKLPVADTFYFVVRARDQAGNVDHNRIERRGVDPCV